jgi:hypothetical protein
VEVLGAGTIGVIVGACANVYCVDSGRSPSGVKLMGLIGCSGLGSTGVAGEIELGEGVPILSLKSKLFSQAFVIASGATRWNSETLLSLFMYFPSAL